MAYEITLENKPDAEEVRVLLEGLHIHNTLHSGGGEAEYLAPSRPRRADASPAVR